MFGQMLLYFVEKGFKAIYSNRISATIFSFVVGVFWFIGLLYNMFWTTVVSSMILILPFVLIVGIIASIVKLPASRKKNAYYRLFEQMNFKSIDGTLPVYISTKEKEYTKTISFLSHTPLDEWLRKKSIIETYFNARIYKIENDPRDNNVVTLAIIKKNLPEQIFWNDNYMVSNPNTLTMGVSYYGIAVTDFNKTPHVLVAGETGSGKSNILKCFIYQCLSKGHDVKLIDFKRGVGFAAFSELVEIYSDYEQIEVVFQWLTDETNRRLDLFRQNKVEDIEQYNLRADREGLQRIVVFIDELAELMRTAERQANKGLLYTLETLTRLSRAAGIHLIMGIQRPDATIISGQIKNNVSMRLCGRFVDPEPSRIVLGSDRATSLPRIKGRFIKKDDDYEEFQG